MSRLQNLFCLLPGTSGCKNKLIDHYLFSQRGIHYCYHNWHTNKYFMPNTSPRRELYFQNYYNATYELSWLPDSPVAFSVALITRNSSAWRRKTRKEYGGFVDECKGRSKNCMVGKDMSTKIKIEEGLIKINSIVHVPWSFRLYPVM